MRFVYLDESGISVHESVVVVAGVMIHADQQWNAVAAYVDGLISEYVPPDQRDGFSFHAKDLFHGSGRIFDKRKYPHERSREALNKVLGIPSKFGMPIVFGYVKKPDGAASIRPRVRAALDHSFAFSLCAVAVEQQMAARASSEVATLIAENNNETRRAVKAMHSLLKGRNLAVEGAADIFSILSTMVPNCLPIRRIVDSVYFAEKEDSILLQVADACALAIRYFYESRANVDDLFNALTLNKPETLKVGDGNMPAGCQAIYFKQVS